MTLADNQVYAVVRFESLDSAYLNYLSQKGFAIHASIQIVERFEFDHSLLVDIAGQHIQLSAAIAKQIFVANLNLDNSDQN